VERFPSCRRRAKVAVVKVVPDRSGNFAVTIPVPAGAKAAVYRAWPRIPEATPPCTPSRSRARSISSSRHASSSGAPASQTSPSTSPANSRASREREAADRLAIRRVRRRRCAAPTVVGLRELHRAPPLWDRARIAMPSTLVIGAIAGAVLGGFLAAPAGAAAAKPSGAVRYLGCRSHPFM
jgi:hypothetical protein